MLLRRTTFRILLATLVVLGMMLLASRSGYRHVLPTHLRKLLNAPTSEAPTEPTKYLPVSFAVTDINHEVNFSKYKDFVVYSNACTIPNIDPWDKAFSRINFKTALIRCPGAPDITYVSNGTLYLNAAVARDNYKGSIAHCQYANITSPPNAKSDREVTVGKLSTPFTTSISVKEHEFLKVLCFSAKGAMIAVNYHALVPYRKKVPSPSLTSSPTQPRTQSERLSVLFVGMDSLSRLNLQRQLSGTRKLLLEEFDAIEFKGYNLVGPNTLVNTIALLSGKSLDEFRPKGPGKLAWDDITFCWKEYGSQGYQTMYSVDVTSMSPFHWWGSGFRKQPTDYYLRPLSLAEEYDKVFHPKQYNRNCWNNRLAVEPHLQWVHDFTRVYEHEPYFSFVFFTRLNHLSYGNARSTDHIFINFLRQTKPLLNNTLLVFFADHGVRSGVLPTLFLGKIEERQPPLFFVLPEWFKKKYPQVVHNLKVNANRLTSPFDVYATLEHVLHWPNIPDFPHLRTGRSISLFTPIPENRNCSQAGIAAHWCVCQRTEEADPSSPLVKSAALKIISDINQKIAGHKDLCQEFSFEKIVNARRAVVSDAMLKHDRRVVANTDFMITVSLLPGSAVYEATVRYDSRTNEMRLISKIMVLTLYAKVAHCMHVKTLRMFCYCHKQ